MKQIGLVDSEEWLYTCVSTRVSEVHLERSKVMHKVALRRIHWYVLFFTQVSQVVTSFLIA